MTPSSQAPAIDADFLLGGQGSIVQIEHIDLAETVNSVFVHSVEALFVFWWKDYPVGQTIEAGQRSRRVDPILLASACVKEDLLALARQKVAEESTNRSRDDRSISVVICTRDRPEDLRRCLASFSAQTLQPSQIVVVDNASVGTNTREVGLAAGVTYVREDRPGLDYARNAGASAASGSIVVYTDDDVRLHPRWLQRMVVAFDDPKIMAVTGLVLPAELETQAQRHFETFWCFGRGYRRIDYGSEFFALDQVRGCPAWEIGAGASMAFRREIFEQIGLFDERLDVGQAGCSGDSEYWHRVLTHGWICRYEPSAVVFHYHRREMAALASQIYSYMRGHAAALLVQYERSRHTANLRRALFWMPYFYLCRFVSGMVRRRKERDLFLKEEIRGYSSGILFYYRGSRGAMKSISKKLRQ